MPRHLEATVDERRYDYVLAYMRRQEYLWDCLDAQTFADAFLAIVDRKRVDARALKISQAGDVRHTADIRKLDRIAQRLEAADADTQVFTYSASSHLDWSVAEHLTVNRSNDAAYGDRRYMIVDDVARIPADALRCPFDAERAAGVSQEDRTKCGECRLCIDPDAPDVAVVK